MLQQRRMRVLVLIGVVLMVGIALLALPSKPIHAQNDLENLLTAPVSVEITYTQVISEQVIATIDIQNIITQVLTNTTFSVILPPDIVPISQTITSTLLESGDYASLIDSGVDLSPTVNIQYQLILSITGIVSTTTPYMQAVVGYELSTGEMIAAGFDYELIPENLTQKSVGSAKGSPWQLAYQPPEASDFTGSANYSYHLNIPPSNGGPSPVLGLHYGSRGVDGMTAPASASGFGSGWSMPQAEITNGNAAGHYDGAGIGSTGSLNYHLFTLSLNGVSYNLAPKSSGRYGLYTALGDDSLEVEYFYTPSTSTPNNITGEYWKVTTSDGTVYSFGSNENSEQTIYPVNSATNVEQTHHPEHMVLSWKLDSITDRNGQQVTYNNTYNNRMGCR